MVSLCRMALRLCFPMIAAALLGACTDTSNRGMFVDGVLVPYIDPATRAMYAPERDGALVIPAVQLESLDPRYYRHIVDVPPGIPYQANSIVVDPEHRFLYYELPNHKAMRYGIGVGREGFAWNGTAQVRRKQEWPKWTPPTEMVARDPSAVPYATEGMLGGIANPLGARAMYLYQGDNDTLYRLHGTNDPSSIGKAMSSGCIRLLNQDVIDLYNRVQIGTRVTVLPAPGEAPSAEIGVPPGSRAPIPPAPIGHV